MPDERSTRGVSGEGKRGFGSQIAALVSSAAIFYLIAAAFARLRRSPGAGDPGAPCRRSAERPGKEHAVAVDQPQSKERGSGFIEEESSLGQESREGRLSAGRKKHWARSGDLISTFGIPLLVSILVFILLFLLLGSAFPELKVVVTDSLVIRIFASLLAALLIYPVFLAAAYRFRDDAYVRSLSDDQEVFERVVESQIGRMGFDETHSRVLRDKASKLTPWLKWKFGVWYWSPIFAVILSMVAGVAGTFLVTMQWNVAFRHMKIAEEQSLLASMRFVLDTRVAPMETLYEESSEDGVLQGRPKYGSRQRAASLVSLSENVKFYRASKQLESLTLRLTGAFLSDLDVPGIELPGVIMNGAMLTDTDLRGADLKGVDLADAELDGTEFIGASLEGANLRFSKGTRVVFDEARISHAKFGGETYQEASFISSQGEKVIFDGGQFPGVSFLRASFVGPEFAGVNLDGAIFDGSTLESPIFSGRTQLSGASFLNAELTDAKISRVVMEDCKLESAKFLGAKTTISGSLLDGCDLYRAELVDADLVSVSLRDADLDSANFSRTTLFRVDFSEAKNFEAANFEGATFKSVKVYGVDLSEASLTQPQLDQTCGDQRTLAPLDLSEPKHWHDQEVTSRVNWNGPGCPPGP